MITYVYVNFLKYVVQEGKRISNKASSETGCIASSDYCYSLKRTTSNNVHDVGSSLPVNTEFGSQMSWLLLNTINTVKTSSAEALKEERTKLEWITKPYKEQKICNFSKIREKKTINNHRVSFDKCPIVIESKYLVLINYGLLYV